MITERTFVKLLVAMLLIVMVFGTRNTDIIFVAVSILFFAICAGYAEWCKTL